MYILLFNKKNGEVSQEMLGPHLTLDLYGCDEEKLVDKEFIFKILDELPDLIGMHKISVPQIILYPGSRNSFDKGGISAFILIAESHISIHTWKGYGYSSVDIFSCKPFDVKQAEEFFIEKLGARKVEKNFMMRGREFPRDIEKVKQIMVRQRKKLK